MDPNLFGRQWTVTVGSVDVSNLDCEFHIKKSIKKDPNTADLKLFNLSRATSEAIGAAVPQNSSTVVPVIISAGYVNAVSTIFSGQLRAAQTYRDGPNTITVLSTGDGDYAIAQTRLTVALGPGSSAAQGLRTILTALGVGQGNLAKALTLLSANPAVSQMFTKGAILKGSASDIMSDFCRSAGLEWSVQNGNLQILDLGQPLDGQAVLMDAAHGMEGSPSVDTKGILSFKCRMIPGIKPGVKVSMNALYVQGGYRVISCEYSGNTKGDEWGIAVEADSY